ncbi:MAG: phage head-tail connector protein [Defluviitaleaceae bacterium]|nr:phage head-tail connector protein [Defluviitaleaceae bacterium]
MDATTLFSALIPPGEPVDDAVRDAQLYIAERFLIDACGITELDESLAYAQVRIAIANLNHMGAEGESSRSEGGVSRSIDMYPVDVQQIIASHRMLPIMNRPETNG